MRTSSSALLLALLGACITDVKTDSTAYLALDRSSTTFPGSVDATSQEIVHLFSTRGITMFDRRPSGTLGGIVIRLAGNQHRVGRGTDAYSVSSVYYARIDPAGTGSKVTLVGKAMVDGQLPCTPATSDGSPYQCPEVSIDSDLSDAVTGQQEASVIYSVLQELSLDAHPS
jgi:hypothetical protein